ncbi:uncharacterized protein LOC121409015 isoform X2 [Lytechinus variegatus]|uniref:uncharacterized protein LOC121409015 isoform X2 n=1 Tax=Lytechinus variegatus TaxID=7654 RepID=UPI001BB1AFCE|nr:uncharacterized protein LOC121409015 isoform X2 [Lytechinus variegatus]
MKRLLVVVLVAVILAAGLVDEIDAKLASSKHRHVAPPPSHIRSARDSAGHRHVAPPPPAHVMNKRSSRGAFRNRNLAHPPPPSSN